MSKTRKKIETRMDEVQFRTLDPSQMLNMYLAEEVKKKWTEDFLDEDSHEIISIERTSPLHIKGTLINQDVLAKIKFDIASGDITEPILVSNQLREGYEWKNTYLQPWQAKALIGEKTVKFLLYGQSVVNVMDILRDYIELNYEGGFTVTEVKEFTDCVILEDTLSDKMDENDINVAYLKDEIDLRTYLNATQSSSNDDDSPKEKKEKKYYQLEFKILSTDKDGEHETTGTFVVNTFDTERAMVIVKAYLKYQDEQRAAQSRDNGIEYSAKSFSLLIEKASPIPVSCFIPLEFSQVYAEK